MTAAAAAPARVDVLAVLDDVIASADRAGAHDVAAKRREALATIESAMALPGKWRERADNITAHDDYNAARKNIYEHCADQLEDAFACLHSVAASNSVRVGFTQQGDAIYANKPAPPATDAPAPAGLPTSDDWPVGAPATVAAAKAYIRDWCPDHVKDYIDGLTPPAGGGDALSADLVRVLRSVASEPDNQGWLASISPPQAREILRLAPAVEVALYENGLLPCPFCGAAALGVVSVTNALPECHSITYSDARCLATVEAGTARRAVLMWNRRLASGGGREGELERAAYDILDNLAAARGGARVGQEADHA